MDRKVFVSILILFVPMLAIIGARSLFANIAGQGETDSITVQIIAYYCQEDLPLLCNLTKSGSGSLIDSNGMILTTYQLVSDTQGYADDFEIRIKSDTTSVYRASRIEVWPEIDSALLKIYYDVYAQRRVNQDPAWIDSALKLPIVPSTDVPSQLYNTTWLSNTQRVWMETLQLEATNEVDTTGFGVTATIHTLDRVDKPLAFLVYIFDKTKRPSTDSETDTVSYTPRDPIPMIYQPKHFADVQTLVVMSNSVESLENLQFRFLIWDIEEKRVLWRDDQWYEVLADGTLPLIPTDPITPGPTSTELPKGCPTDMERVKTDNSLFCMDIHEVTNAEYEICVKANLCSSPSDTRTTYYSQYYGDPTYADYPVVWVNWEQADQYCQQFHEFSGQSDVQKILPTAQQWNEAQSGIVVNESLLAQIRAFADTMPVMNNQQDRTTNGVYDLIGNVREWASDNSAEAASKKNVMGASYQDDPFPPNSETLDTSLGDIGFRCVVVMK